MNGSVGCSRNLQSADEVLFDEPVLRRLQHLWVRQDRFSPGEERGGLRRHVFEFIGYDVDSAGKAPERGFVFVRRTGARMHHVKCAGVLFGRINMAAQAQGRCRECEHACELAAAENTDGGAGLEQGSIFGPFGHGLGLARAPGVKPLRDPCVRQRKHGGRKQRGIGCSRLADGERTDRNPSRHLHDR